MYCSHFKQRKFIKKNIYIIEEYFFIIQFYYKFNLHRVYYIKRYNIWGIIHCTWIQQVSQKSFKKDSFNNLTKCSKKLQEDCSYII